MLTYYLTLGLSLDASDEDIRNSYIQLVKKYTPEKNPERFRQITTAYEAIKDKRSRIEAKIFGALKSPDYKDALLSLLRNREQKRRRAGLQELFQAVREK